MELPKSRYFFVEKKNSVVLKPRYSVQHSLSNGIKNYKQLIPSSIYAINMLTFFMSSFIWGIKVQRRDCGIVSWEIIFRSLLSPINYIIEDSASLRNCIFRISLRCSSIRNSMGYSIAITDENFSMHQFQSTSTPDIK